MFLGRLYEKLAHTDGFKKSCWPFSLGLEHLKSVVVTVKVSVGQSLFSVGPLGVFGMKVAGGANWDKY